MTETRHLFLSFALLAASAMAQAGLAVYPIKQLIGFQSDAEAKPWMDPVFIAAIQEKGPAFYVNEFTKDFQQHFGAEEASTIDAHNRLKTFAASLQLTRASHYQVSGLDGTTTHFFPVTVSLNMTNPLTGEVVYSVSKTRYEVAKLLSSADDAEVRQQQIQLYQRNLSQLIDTVVSEAAANFKPAEISAGISREWNGLFILDRGLDAGIAPGDDLQDASGNLIKVIHAGNGYSVASPVLVGHLDPSARFAKYTTLGVNDIKKPKLLILPEVARQDGRDDVVDELFAQLLSKDTAFTLIPVNHNYQQVLNALDRETELGQMAVKQNRALPDYFVRLHAMLPNVYELPTNSKTVIHREYEAMAFGEVMDNSGAVVFAATAQSKIDDEIVNGTGFDIGARYEVLLKNVVQELADKFSAGVHFKPIAAAVTRVDGHRVLVQDPSNALDEGETVHVYHEVAKSAAEPIRVPVWDAQVVARHGAQVELALLLPQTDAIQKNGILPEAGDTVLTQKAGKASDSSIRFQPCTTDETQLGDFKLPEFGALAYYQFAEYSKFPFYSRWQETRASIEALTRTAGFRDTLNTQQAQAISYCIQPTTKIEILGRDCQNAVCTVTVKANLAFGVRGPNDDKPRYFGQKIQPVISKVPEANIDEVIDSQLLDAIPAILKEGARQIDDEPWRQ